jgi:hypothetical protein
MAKLTQKELAAAAAAAAAASASEDTVTANAIAFEVRRDALAYEIIREDPTLALSRAKELATKQLQDEATNPPAPDVPADA